MFEIFGQKVEKNDKIKKKDDIVCLGLFGLQIYKFSNVCVDSTAVRKF